jgi:hypothetical protein
VHNFSKPIENFIHIVVDNKHHIAVWLVIVVLFLSFDHGNEKGCNLHTS